MESYKLMWVTSFLCDWCWANFILPRAFGRREGGGWSFGLGGWAGSVWETFWCGRRFWSPLMSSMHVESRQERTCHPRAWIPHRPERGGRFGTRVPPSLNNYFRLICLCRNRYTLACSFRSRPWLRCQILEWMNGWEMTVVSPRSDMGQFFSRSRKGPVDRLGGLNLASKGNALIGVHVCKWDLRRRA